MRSSASRTTSGSRKRFGPGTPGLGCCLLLKGVELSFDVNKLADQVLIDPDGHEERLGDRWAERPQVVLFLRHFG